MKTQNEYTPEQLEEMEREEHARYARVREEALAGFRDAMEEMGEMFAYGYGSVKPSYSDAKSWYLRARQAGLGAGKFDNHMYMLDMMLRQGRFNQQKVEREQV